MSEPATETTIPDVEPSILDVLKVLDGIAAIGLAAAPLFRGPHVVYLFSLWCAAKRSGATALIEEEPRFGEPLSKETLHEVAGDVAALAVACSEVLARIQPLLAAHDRLHLNANKKERG